MGEAGSALVLGARRAAMEVWRRESLWMRGGRGMGEWLVGRQGRTSLSGVDHPRWVGQCSVGVKRSRRREPFGMGKFKNE